MNAKWQNCLVLSYSNLQPHTIYTIRAQRQHLAAENAKQLLLPVLPPSQDTNKITNQVTATQQEQPSTKQERTVAILVKDILYYLPVPGCCSWVPTCGGTLHS